MKADNLQKYDPLWQLGFHIPYFYVILIREGFQQNKDNFKSLRKEYLS